MQNLAKNLKSLLLRANISENELARRTGISQQIINRILTGQNQNPKIATLSPLANYFMVSISELIGDEFHLPHNGTNKEHLGLTKIPLIDIDLLSNSSIEKLRLTSQYEIQTDIGKSQDIFAIALKDDSMEPKFSKGTYMIFSSVKQPNNGDFILLGLENNEVVVRQLFRREDKKYIKSLNPNSIDYEVRTLKDPWTCFGVLVQSKTNFI